MLSALALQGMQKSPTIVAVAIPVVSFGLPILETALSVVRRLISGRPVFTGDREHIHHKLLQRGLSQRQVVTILYAVSAVFAMLSLFMLWPTGSTLGLVLAVLGIGIWIGVQHLNYLEFGELRRVAQRTLEQRLIFINNLAIRRAAEELKVASDFEQLCRILEAAFSSNDFDAFELRLRPPDEPAEIRDLQIVSADEPHFHWKKRGSRFNGNVVPGWSLTLDLVAANNRRRGSLTVYRLYDGRDLQLDMNLLTSILPVALADALDVCSVTRSKSRFRLRKPRRREPVNCKSLLLASASGLAAKAHRSEFFQSEFYGPSHLRKSSASYVPTLNEEGLSQRFILERMKGDLSLEAIAKEPKQRFREASQLFKRV